MCVVGIQLDVYKDVRVLNVYAPKLTLVETGVHAHFCQLRDLCLCQSET